MTNKFNKYWCDIHNKNITFLNSILLILTPLAIFNFYNYVNAPSFLKIISYIVFPIVFIYCFKTILYSHFYLSKLYKLLLFSTFMSMIMAYIYHSQSFELSYRICAFGFLGYIYYFLLHQIKPSVKTVEILIVIFLLIYIFIWLYALSQAPHLVFGQSGFEDAKSVDFDRGVFRIKIVGDCFLPLSIFYFINKYISTRKLIFLIFSILIFFIVILHVTRQLIFFSFLLSILYLMKKRKIMRILIVFTLILIIFSPNILKFSQNSILGLLINTTSNQINDNIENQDVRLLCYKHIFLDFPNNPLTILFGNCMEHSNSLYGDYIRRTMSSKGLYPSDVGYAAIYLYNGLLGFYIFMSIFIKSLTAKIDPDYYYIKLLFIYILIINFTSIPLIGAAIAICMCSYIIDKKVLKQPRKI